MLTQRQVAYLIAYLIDRIYPCNIQLVLHHNFNYLDSAAFSSGEVDVLNRVAYKSTAAGPRQWILTRQRQQVNYGAVVYTFKIVYDSVVIITYKISLYCNDYHQMRGVQLL